MRVYTVDVPPLQSHHRRRQDARQRQGLRGPARRHHRMAPPARDRTRGSRTVGAPRHLAHPAAGGPEPAHSRRPDDDGPPRRRRDRHFAGRHRRTVRTARDPRRQGRRPGRRARRSRHVRTAPARAAPGPGADRRPGSRPPISSGAWSSSRRSCSNVAGSPRSAARAAALPSRVSRSSNSSSISSREMSVTTTPRPPVVVRPSAVSRLSASRSGVREMPRRSDCSTSASTVPGRRRHSMMSSRRAA